MNRHLLIVPRRGLLSYTHRQNACSGAIFDQSLLSKVLSNFGPSPQGSVFLPYRSFSFLAFISGCKPGYVIDAGIGQWRLLSGSRPLEELRKEGALTDEELASADLVLDIKRFAESEIGLKKTANYRKVYVGPSLSQLFVLSASPKDRLQLRTWWFPIIGRIPYLGFFHEQEALDEQQPASK